MKLLTFIAAALVVTLTPAINAATLTIASDASGSNPLLKDTNFNKAAAEHAAALVKGLAKGDSVVLQSFGQIDAPQNFERKTVAIKRHNAKKVAAQVQRYLQDLPNTVKAQGATNLIAYLGRNDFDCANGSKLLVLTDGIEFSEYVNGNHLLAGKVQLPAPNILAKKRLKGCDVQFYGLGVGRQDKEMLRLYEAWSVYFEQAGANFDAVIK